MRIIKSSQQDVFSEYLKIMSRFNEKRSLKKTASLLSGFKLLPDIAQLADLAKALTMTVEELSKLPVEQIVKMEGFAKYADEVGGFAKALKSVTKNAEYTTTAAKMVDDLPVDSIFLENA